MASRQMVGLVCLALVAFASAEVYSNKFPQGQGGYAQGPSTFPATGGRPIPAQEQTLGVQPGVENVYDRNQVAGSAPSERFFLKPPTWGSGWGSGYDEGEKTLKRGNCPVAPPISEYRLSCQTRECEEDEDCHGIRKCCRYDCAAICVNPVQMYPWLPHSSGFGQHEVPHSNNHEHFQGHQVSLPQEKPRYYYNSYHVPSPVPSLPSTVHGQGHGHPPELANNHIAQIPSITSAPIYFPPEEGNRPGKPGSCARPQNQNFGGYSSGSGFNGGNNGGNGWNPNPGYQRCSNDYNCRGNQKCCSGFCRTPAVVIG